MCSVLKGGFVVKYPLWSIIEQIHISPGCLCLPCCHRLDAGVVEGHWPIMLFGHWPWLPITSAKYLMKYMKWGNCLLLKLCMKTVKQSSYLASCYMNHRGLPLTQMGDIFVLSYWRLRAKLTYLQYITISTLVPWSTRQVGFASFIFFFYFKWSEF